MSRLNIGSAMVRVFKAWPELLAIVSERHIRLRYEETQDLYEVYAIDDGVVYVAYIYRGDVPSVSGVTQEQNDAHKAVFEASYKAKANATKLTADGRPRVAHEKPDAPRVTIISHDWTDPTTWYTESVRAVGEAASHVSGAVWQLAHVNVIDNFHGKLFGEDFLVSAAGHTYRVAVTVGGTAKTEVDPHTLAGDFTVNYETGAITFTGTPPASNADVRATYHYATTSGFIVAPIAGRTLSIDLAEVQFSEDVVITDSTLYQPYGYVDVFAPHLVGPIPSGTRIPLGNPVSYKTIRDYYAESVKSYPRVSPLGGNGWRGMSQGVIVLDWDYLSSIKLRSDAGMQLRMSLAHDTPFGGTYASCTMYCTSEEL